MSYPFADEFITWYYRGYDVATCITYLVAHFQSKYRSNTLSQFVVNILCKKKIRTFTGHRKGRATQLHWFKCFTGL